MTPPPRTETKKRCHAAHQRHARKQHLPPGQASPRASRAQIAPRRAVGAPRARTRGAAPPPEEHAREHARDMSARAWPDPPALGSVDLGAAPAPAAGAARAPAAVIDPARLEYDLANASTRIGVGTFGSVHVARYFGELVAVKCVRLPPVAAAVAADPNVAERRREAMRQFARELRRFEAVSHPGLVRFLGVTLPEKHDFTTALLVTELMHGGSLAEGLASLRRARVPMDVLSLTRIALQVCSGIRALHHAHFTWGDAKPENILLSAPLDSASGCFPDYADARIADFGLSRTVGGSLLAETTISGGEPAGSPAYLAPECFQTGVSPRDRPHIAKAADIYALGLVMYEMLTLRTPWRHCSMMEVYSSVVAGARPPWPVEGDDDYRAPIPAELVLLIEKCWQQKPLDRPSPGDVFDSILRFRNRAADTAATAAGRDARRPSNSPRFQMTSQHPQPQEQENGASPVEGVLSKNYSASTAVAFDDVPVEIVPNESYPDDDGMEGASNDDAFPQSPGATTDNSGSSSSSNSADYVAFIDEPVGNGDCDGCDVTAAAKADATVSTTRFSPVTSPDDAASRHLSLVGTPGNTVRDASKRLDAAITIDRLASVLPGLVPSKELGFSVDSKGEYESVDVLYKKNSDPLVADSGPVDFDMHLNVQDCGESPLTEDEIRSTMDEFTATDTADYLTFRETFAQATAESALRQQREASNCSETASPYPANSAPYSVAPADGGVTSASPGLDADRDSAGLGDIPGGTSADLFSSGASNASMRRRRSKRLQAIIEEAGKAFLELHRREEVGANTTPNQRRRAAERKAADEAKAASEEEALASITKEGEEHNFSGVMDVMRGHEWSQKVVKAGVIALEVACRMDEQYFDVCEEGAVDLMLSAAAQFGERDAELCMSFCRCITALSKWYDAKVGHLIRAIGIHSEVCALIEWHTGDVEVQTAACECLAALAQASELSRSAVATLGGSLSVYRAMTRNLSCFKSVPLAKAALEAMQRIAERNERAAETLVEISAVDCISRAADIFADDGLEENILSALEAFSFYDGGRRTIILSEGLRALSSLMLRKRETEFSVRCCVFTRSVARWRDTKCEDAMLATSVSERITSTLKHSRDTPGEEGARLSWYSAQAVMYLASFGPKSRQRLRLTGAIDAVIELLNARRENPRVATMSIDALAELLKDDRDAAAHAEKCDVSPVLNMISKKFPDNPRVQQRVALTIRFLAPLREEGGTGIAPSVRVRNSNMGDLHVPKKGFGFSLFRRR